MGYRVGGKIEYDPSRNSLPKRCKRRRADILFLIQAYSLTQTAVPHQLLDGFVIAQTGQVALIYAVVGLLIFGIAFSFFFTHLGLSEKYLTKDKSS